MACLDTGTGFASQVYELSRIFVHKDWIMEQWDNSFYITAIAGASNGSSLVVMSKGTRTNSRHTKSVNIFLISGLMKSGKKAFM